MSDSNIPLTAGSCERLQFADPQTDSSVFESPHTVQFLSIKKVTTANQATNSSVDRYRIIISDGTYFIQAMLATQLNEQVQKHNIGKHTVAVIEKATCNYVQEKRLIIVLELRVLLQLPDKIGDPKQLVPDSKHVPDSNASVTPAAPSISIQKPQPPNKPSTNQRERGVFPIEGLSPYQNNWTIKARVTQKSEMKTWSNNSGEGKLFSVTFMDDSGEIRATAFNIVADDLYPRLEEGKVYYVSKARVGLAKKKFSNLPNDYELSLESRTEVEECHDTSNLPTVKYNFVPLNGLEALPKDSMCDVIGVVKEASDVASITSKTTNRQIPKRELTLVDRSNYSVRLTLWGKQAEQYKAETTSVIAFKGVRIGDFGGRSLSMTNASSMAVNPDIEESHKLQGWYATQGQQQNFHAQSSNNPGGNLGFRRDEIRTLEDVKQAGVGTGDKPDYFSTRATIMHIKEDNIAYPGCAMEGCSKKVFEEGGAWRCEKCEKSFPSPEYRYIMSIMVADYTGKAWFQGFNEVGTAIYGMSANELINIRDNDNARFKSIQYQATCGNAYNFSCRAKEDEYNGVRRVRFGISRLSRIDYKEEAGYLRDLLYSAWAR